MRAKITARDEWTDDMVKEFGEPGSIVILPDDSDRMLEELSRHGRFRATLSKTGNYFWEIEFHNGYD